MARLQEPQRLLTGHGGGRSTPARWLSAAHVVLLLALVVGLVSSISVAQIAFAALGAWVLVARRLGVLPPLVAPLWVPIAVFAAWTVIAALASSRPGESLIATKHLLTLAAVWVVANAVPGTDGARRFLGALVVALAVVSALAVVLVAGCPDDAVTAARGFFRKCARARGFFSIYMTLAGVLALVLTAALPRVVRPGRAGRWLVPAWLLGVTAHALTYVRGAWLGFAAGAGAALVTLPRRAVAVLLVLATAGFLVLLPGVAQRLGTLGDPADATTRDRLAMISAGLRLTREHPLTGLGPGLLKHVYPSVAPPEALRRSTSHLHNTPLQITVERGLVGLAAWLAMFAAFFVRTARIFRRLPREADTERALVVGPGLAIVAFLVGGLFEYNFGDSEVLMVALALMALPFVVEREQAAAGAGS